MLKKDIISQKPIFIVGAPRSGTTLLQFMMRSHPNISFPTGESHFFIPLYIDRYKYGDLRKKKNVYKVLDAMYQKNPEFIESDMHGLYFDKNLLSHELWKLKCNTIPEIINRIYKKNAFGEGKTRWGEKTPYYILHMKTLKEMFPYALFIHIIRDGRDAAMSMIKRKKDLKIFNIYHSAKIWKQYVETGINVGNEIGNKYYYQLRYEDLIIDPKKYIKEICNFINEPYYESVVNYQKTKNAKGKTPLLQRNIDRRNINKWKKSMTKRQITVFENIAGVTLENCGYNLYKENNKCKKLSFLLYRTHIKASYLWYKKMKISVT